MPLTTAAAAETHRSLRTASATEATMIAAPASVTGATTSSRISQPSTIATTGFTYA